MSRKSLPPAPGDDLAATLRARHHPDTRQGTQPPAPRTDVDADVDDRAPSPQPNVRPEPATGAGQPRQRPEPSVRADPPAMARRSWYMPTATASTLAELVDDLHHQTRAPRHLIWTAISDQLTAHRDQLLDRLPPAK